MQADAEKIAAAFHHAEKKLTEARIAVKEADVAFKNMHRLLTPFMPMLGEKLGIDVKPLSGGGPKPPR